METKIFFQHESENFIDCNITLHILIHLSTLPHKATQYHVYFYVWIKMCKCLHNPYIGFFYPIAVTLADSVFFILVSVDIQATFIVLKCSHPIVFEKWNKFSL